MFIISTIFTKGLVTPNKMEVRWSITATKEIVSKKGSNHRVRSERKAIPKPTSVARQSPKPTIIGAAVAV